MCGPELVGESLGPSSGRYRHATVAEGGGRRIFISGMTARRRGGSITGVGDVRARARQVCENLKAAVAATGGTLNDVYGVDVSALDLAHLAAVREVGRECLSEASTLVGLPALPAPEQVIEMNAIAVVEA